MTLAAASQQAGSCAAGPIFEGYGARIAKDEFDITQDTPGMTTTLAMKDLRHIRDLAKDSKVCAATRGRHTARDCCCVVLCVKIAAPRPARRKCWVWLHYKRHARVRLSLKWQHALQLLVLKLTYNHGKTLATR